MPKSGSGNKKKKMQYRPAKKKGTVPMPTSPKKPIKAKKKTINRKKSKINIKK